MSAVPELDKLLEEAEIVRRNKQWDRMDRLLRRTLGYVTLCLLLLAPAYCVCGKLGAAAVLLGALFSVVPVLGAAVFVILRVCFTDPPPRDPTQRYMYK